MASIYFVEFMRSSLSYPVFPRMRTLQSIDYSEARRAVDLIVEKASQMQKAVVVAVADSHGDLICLARMDGAPVSSILVATNKAWTAARERKPTKEIGEKVRHPEKGHDIAYYGDPKYVGWAGGVPVWKNGDVVGAVAVSGLSSNEDIALATLGVELIVAA
ncbi:MAG: heme-binding protein [Candidatus Sulfotelmatobacter sp.]|jgi:glc operon protein GlcG